MIDFVPDQSGPERAPQAGPLNTVMLTWSTSGRHSSAVLVAPRHRQHRPPSLPLQWDQTKSLQLLVHEAGVVDSPDIIQSATCLTPSWVHRRALKPTHAAAAAAATSCACAAARATACSAASEASAVPSTRITSTSVIPRKPSILRSHGTWKSKAAFAPE